MPRITRIFAGLTSLATATACLADAQGTPHAVPDAGQVAATSTGLEEIVVTAQRRAENLQKVPIAVTAVSAEALENSHLENTSQLGSLVPGLRVIDASASAGVFFLRGVGQTSGAAGSVSPISVYLDGIYLGYGQLAALSLNNIRQITVLRGPQGSLFGRNASGGIIQVTTQDPTADAGGRATLGYANYNTLSGSLYATGAFADTLSANLSLKASDETTGWMKNVVTGDTIAAEQAFSAQSKLLWLPDADTRITTNLIYQYSGHLPGTAVHQTPGHLNADGVTGYLGEDKIATRHDPYGNTGTLLGAVKEQHDFSWAQLTNISYGLTNATHFRAEYGSPGRPNPNNVPEQSVTQNANMTNYGDDLQLQALPDEDLQWVMGFAYGYEHIHNMFTVDLDETLASQITSASTTNSIAGFAQATKTVLPQTRLTAGVRYTSETEGFVGVSNKGATAATGGLPPEETWDKLTWRAAIDHDLTSQVLVYVSDNRGFKSGQYNLASLSNRPVNPEVVDSYELGLKSRFFEERIRVNLAAFHTDISNLQLKALNAGAVVLYNAASAGANGLDVDFSALATDNLTLTGGFEWLPYADYRRFPGAASQRPTPIATAPAGCTGAANLRVGGTAAFICDLSGYRMIEAPKASINIGFEYRWNLTGGAKLALSANDSYSTRYYVDSDHTTSVNPYHLVNASVRWTSPEELWDVKLWGTNIAYAKTYWNTQFYYIAGEPPRYGLEVARKF